MTKRARIATIALIAVSAFLAGGIGLFRSIEPDPEPAPAAARCAGRRPTSWSRPRRRAARCRARSRRCSCGSSRSPEDWQSLAGLGLAYVQQARITVDPSFYPRAEGGIGTLADAAARRTTPARSSAWRRSMPPDTTSQHRSIGRSGHCEQSPGTADALGVRRRRTARARPLRRGVRLVPAHGRHPPRPRARTPVCRTPGSSWATRAARSRPWKPRAGSPAPPPTSRGRASSSASSRSTTAGSTRPRRVPPRRRRSMRSFVANLAGLAKVAWARGDRDEAIERYEEVVTRLPLPEYVIALGDAYAATGDAETAARRLRDRAARTAALRLERRQHRPRARAVRRGSRAARGRPARRPRRVGATPRACTSPMPWRGPCYANGRADEAVRYSKRALCARHAQRLVPLPRCDDPAGARRSRRGANAARRGDRHEPPLLDPARGDGGTTRSIA